MDDSFDDYPDDYAGAPDPTIDGIPLPEFIRRFGWAEAERRFGLAFEGLRIGPAYDHLRPKPTAPEAAE